MKMISKAVGRPTRTSRERRMRGMRLILYLLPFMALMALFTYVPLFGWTYAFIRYTPGVSVFQSEFVGLYYIKMIFSGASDFWLVMRNTLAISGLNILLSFVPVVFAILINQLRSTKMSRGIQTLTSIPNFISWVLVYAIVFILVGSEDSALNTVLLTTGLVKSPVNLLSDPNIAWPVQIAIGIWKTTGWSAILYLSAISSIDQELYQAAEVDGAGRMRKVVHVTLPGILPTFFVLLLLAIANMLSNGFDQFWLFQNGLTVDRLEVFDTYVYRLGLKSMEYSLSTAMGIFKSLVSIGLLTLANGASRLVRGESIF